MSNKLFISVVVLLWLIAMGWLFTAKIFPPLGQDKPPGYTGLAVDDKTCWRIFCNEQPIGWAASRVAVGTGGTKEVHARLLISQVRLTEVASWLAKEMKSLNLSLGLLDLDARSRIEIDRLGHLSALEARVKFAPLPITVEVRGRVEQSELHLHFKTGTFSYEIDRVIPENARLGTELAPTGKLPAMYKGRKWQLESINPLSAGKTTELLQAEVVDEEIIQFDNQLLTARRLEYRRVNQTAGVQENEAVLATLWIAEDGVVLRQEASILGVKFRFERKLDAKSLKRVETLTDPKLQSADRRQPSANRNP